MFKTYPTLIISLFLFFGIGNSQNQPYQSFKLQFYQPTEETEIFAQYLIESGVIEDAVSDLEQTFLMPETVTINFGPGLDGPSYFQGEINMPYDFMLNN